MSQYASPGVYVEEVPSAVKPIAGVATSTAAFVGVIQDSYLVEEWRELSTQVDQTSDKPALPTLSFPTWKAGETLKEVGEPVQVRGRDRQIASLKLQPQGSQQPTGVTLTLKSPVKQGRQIPVVVPYLVAVERQEPLAVPKRVFSKDLGSSQTISLSDPQLLRVPQTVKVQYGKEQHDLPLPDAAGAWTVTLPTPLTGGQKVLGSYVVAASRGIAAKAGQIKLCTSFADFQRFFGDFTPNSGQNRLAHAVYGFFNNGGSRCYVGYVEASGDLSDLLEELAKIDEVALVAAPGLTEPQVYSALASHCENLEDRFAIFDAPELLEDAPGVFDPRELDPSAEHSAVPQSSTYAAYYLPWIQVFDPVTKALHPASDGTIYAPPSGHLAGIYARVDTRRGVFKAPANEGVRGALGLKYRLDRAQQGGLNPHGINVLRELRNQILVWGARTLGGDANGEWKYINVRRSALFLEESIDQGTQWAVFEPNDAALWAKIARNVTAFLTNFWRQGGLFGAKPEEAFYVKCDAETNPPSTRDLGQVITEIGVALVRPAEFVVFRVSQWAGPAK